MVFYPGHREDNNFNLFDRLDDQHTYRATLLIND
ncbi:BREX protein BrxB domain-containing protein [Bacteroides thetaiotaomicron]|nr:BREX protein BrxB domain-containing protein [Bacteroides thetaiotaomicron]